MCTLATILVESLDFLYICTSEYKRHFSCHLTHIIVRSCLHTEGVAGIVKMSDHKKENLYFNIEPDKKQNSSN